MRRDMDLIRLVLLELEDDAPVDFNGYDEDAIAYHRYLVMNAGLANGSDVTTHGDKYRQALLFGLTWQGHEFLDAARNETVWKRIKATVKEKGGSLPFSVVQSLAIEIAKNVAGL